MSEGSFWNTLEQSSHVSYECTFFRCLDYERMLRYASFRLINTINRIPLQRYFVPITLAESDDTHEWAWLSIQRINEFSRLNNMYVYDWNSNLILFTITMIIGLVNSRILGRRYKHHKYQLKVYCY